MNTGRVVLITGAAGAMGSMIADRFLAKGAAVIANDTKGEAP